MTNATHTILDYREIPVTAELAHEWLTLNTSNRSLKPGQVSAFAKDMRDGRWSLTGEAIKFSGAYENPTQLLDGQNRLHAVIKSGVTVILSVFFNVRRDAQGAMDSGTKRTVSDNLKIGGGENTSVIAAAASIAIRAKEGRLNGGTLGVTNAYIEDFISANPDLAESAKVAQSYARRADIAPSFVAYSHWVFNRIDPVDAVEFWRAASEKVGLREGDPVIAMTNRFAEARRNREKVRLESAISAIFRAWNYRRAGKPLKTMRFNSSAGLIPIPNPR